MPIFSGIMVYFAPNKHNIVHFRTKKIKGGWENKYSYGNTIHEHAKRIKFLPGVDGVDDVVVHLLVLAHLVDELDEQDKS